MSLPLSRHQFIVCQPRVIIGRLLLLGCLGVGCDKVETLVGDAKKDMGVGAPAPVVESPSAVPASSMTPAQPEPTQPTGPSSESLLTDLKNRPSNLIDDAMLNSVAASSDAATQVTELNLTSNLNVSGAGLAAVSKFSNLTKLQMSGVSKVVSGEFPALAGLKLLNELEADFTQIGNDTLPVLAGLSQLKKLSLAGTKLEGAAASQLATLTSLEELNFAETAVDDATIVALQALPLKKLTLRRTRITNNALAAIGNHPTLEFLDIGETAVTGVGFAKAKFPELRVLIAARTSFGVDGVMNAKRFPKLEELWLYQAGLALDNGSQWDKRADFKAFPSLKLLHVGNNQVSDVGISRLIVGAKHLESLYVNQLQGLTDRGLAEILKCKGLKLLDVSQSSVSSPALLALKEKMPDLVIVNGGSKL